MHIARMKASEPGEAIVGEDFVGQGQVVNGLDGTLTTDQAKDKNTQLQAVTITLDDQRAVGGFLQPGDIVNVLVTMKVDEDKIKVLSPHLLMAYSGEPGASSTLSFTTRM